MNVPIVMDGTETIRRTDMKTLIVGIILFACLILFAASNVFAKGYHRSGIVHSVKTSHSLGKSFGTRANMGSFHVHRIKF